MLPVTGARLFGGHHIHPIPVCVRRILFETKTPFDIDLRRIEAGFPGCNHFKNADCLISLFFLIRIHSLIELIHPLQLDFRCTLISYQIIDPYRPFLSLHPYRVPKNRYKNLSPFPRYLKGSQQGEQSWSGAMAVCPLCQGFSRL
jgi:hypothetical protein